jgi:site-specific recombinase XerC
VEEIIAVMRQTTDDHHGWRLRALIVVLRRGGLRVQEALALTERDLDPRRGSLLVRNGRGGRRREIGMDSWGWEQLRPWLAARVELPSTARPADARGQAPVCASSFAGSPPKRACGGDSRRTSCATRTLLSSPARGWR